MAGILWWPLSNEQKLFLDRWSNVHLDSHNGMSVHFFQRMHLTLFLFTFSIFFFFCRSNTTLKASYTFPVTFRENMLLCYVVVVNLLSNMPLITFTAYSSKKNILQMLNPCSKFVSTAFKYSGKFKGGGTTGPYPLLKPNLAYKVYKKYYVAVPHFKCYTPNWPNLFFSHRFLKYFCYPPLLIKSWMRPCLHNMSLNFLDRQSRQYQSPTSSLSLNYSDIINITLCWSLPNI